MKNIESNGDIITMNCYVEGDLNNSFLLAIDAHTFDIIKNCGKSGLDLYLLLYSGSHIMRMKEDHMLNGQLKPAYNVQVTVENYFIIHGYVSNDRTDYNTLVPVLEKHREAFGDILEEVTADSGYCSEKNLLYLKENAIASYIKLQDHEQRKTRAYREDIGKYYNMKRQVSEDGHYYICHDGRELRHVRTETREKTSPAEESMLKGTEFRGRCLFGETGLKSAISRQPLVLSHPHTENLPPAAFLHTMIFRFLIQSFLFLQIPGMYLSL
jgi:hypothetical protein